MEAPDRELLHPATGGALVVDYRPHRGSLCSLHRCSLVADLFHSTRMTAKTLPRSPSTMMIYLQTMLMGGTEAMST